MDCPVCGLVDHDDSWLTGDILRSALRLHLVFEGFTVSAGVERTDEDIRREAFYTKVFRRFMREK